MTTGERMLAIIGHLRMSKNSFALSIGVSSTVINGIVNNSNNPGHKVIKGITEVYPEFNADWLLHGKGEMLKVVEPKLVDRDYLQEYLAKLEQQFRELRDQLNVKDTQIANLQELLKMSLGKRSPASGESKEFLHPTVFALVA